MHRLAFLAGLGASLVLASLTVVSPPAAHAAATATGPRAPGDLCDESYDYPAWGPDSSCPSGGAYAQPFWVNKPVSPAEPDSWHEDTGWSQPLSGDDHGRALLWTTNRAAWNDGTGPGSLAVAAWTAPLSPGRTVAYHVCANIPDSPHAVGTVNYFVGDPGGAFLNDEEVAAMVDQSKHRGECVPLGTYWNDGMDWGGRRWQPGQPLPELTFYISSADARWDPQGGQDIVAYTLDFEPVGADYSSPPDGSPLMTGPAGAYPGPGVTASFVLGAAAAGGGDWPDRYAWHSTSPHGFREAMLWAPTTTNPSDTVVAIWSLHAAAMDPPPKEVALDVWIPNTGAGSKDALYTVDAADGVHRFRLNQTLYRGSWATLGDVTAGTVFPTHPGSVLMSVMLSNNGSPGQRVVADALRFTPVFPAAAGSVDGGPFETLLPSDPSKDDVGGSWRSVANPSDAGGTAHPEIACHTPLDGRAPVAQLSVAGGWLSGIPMDFGIGYLPLHGSGSATLAPRGLQGSYDLAWYMAPASCYVLGRDGRRDFPDAATVAVDGTRTSAGEHGQGSWVALGRYRDPRNVRYHAQVSITQGPLPHPLTLWESDEWGYAVGLRATPVVAPTPAAPDVPRPRAPGCSPFTDPAGNAGVSCRWHATSGVWTEGADGFGVALNSAGSAAAVALDGSTVPAAALRATGLVPGGRYLVSMAIPSTGYRGSPDPQTFHVSTSPSTTSLSVPAGQGTVSLGVFPADRDGGLTVTTAAVPGHRGQVALGPLLVEPDPLSTCTSVSSATPPARSCSATLAGAGWHYGSLRLARVGESLPYAALDAAASSGTAHATWNLTGLDPKVPYRLSLWWPHAGGVARYRVLGSTSSARALGQSNGGATLGPLRSKPNGTITVEMTPTGNVGTLYATDLTATPTTTAAAGTPATTKTTTCVPRGGRSCAM